MANPINPTLAPNARTVPFRRLQVSDSRGLGKWQVKRVSGLGADGRELANENYKPAFVGFGRSAWHDTCCKFKADEAGEGA